MKKLSYLCSGFREESGVIYGKGHAALGAISLLEVMKNKSKCS